MRVTKEPGFVIHTRAYSETSLLVDLFSRHHGRLMVLAKGARRQKSAFRGALLPFRALATGWTGKGEVPVLTLAEPAEPWFQVRGSSLVCGFYCNELVLKLLHRHDAHPRLFDHYAEVMIRLKQHHRHEGILRLFEKRLLTELGYAMSLDREADRRREIDPAATYRYIPQRGAVPLNDESPGGVPISGAALRALRDEALTDNAALRECKQLMRVMIAQHLGRRPLHSRKLFR